MRSLSLHHHALRPTLSLTSRTARRPSSNLTAPPASPAARHLNTTSRPQPPLRRGARPRAPSPIATPAARRPTSSTMAPSKPLFTIPIEQQGDATAAGSVTVTTPAERVYVVTFESPPDNRITSNFVRAYLLALDVIEHRHPAGVVVSTSSIRKFFSNGMDLGHVATTPTFFADSFYPLFRRLSTFPMPTVALINGHAFAGGLIFAMHHDYRFQAGDKGYLSLNEVLFGAVLQPPMLSVFREKVDPTTFRDLVLEGHRFPAKQSLERGLVDGIGGLDEALDFVKQRDLVKKADAGVYGMLKEDMYRNTIGLLLQDEVNQRWRRSIEHEKKATWQEAEERIKAWEDKNGKAKL